MRYRYYICDVFTDVRFGGNQLAVVPGARGLSAAQMQQIAREFNFSETTFVAAAESGHTRKVRIFTPTSEIPFAGHPNVGTAFVLAASGELGAIDSATTVTFEEQAGLVPISIQRRFGGRFWCELAAPQPLTLGQSVSPRAAAAALSLAPADISTGTHPPQVASVGLPFLIVELAGRDALVRAASNRDALQALVADGITPDIHLYTRSSDGFDIRARMFAPLDGVAEDPATGSANCALAALLGHCDPMPTGELSWRIAQGVEMGRPSVLDARTEKADGQVVATYIGGMSVLVSEGWIEVG